jgi:hypothetical protein
MKTMLFYVPKISLSFHPCNRRKIAAQSRHLHYMNNKKKNQTGNKYTEMAQMN